jgi:hypothetical protein
MAQNFKRVFGVNMPVIGMVHLGARPGALNGLTRMLVTGIRRTGPGFNLDRDDFIG